VQTPLNRDERPVLLQHNLLRDGVVFGDDQANWCVACDAIARVTCCDR
jgi:hypothetical protein